MLQVVAACCSVLQWVSACCSVLQCVAVCCSVLQCAAVRHSASQCVAVLSMGWQQCLGAPNNQTYAVATMPRRPKIRSQKIRIFLKTSSICVVFFQKRAGDLGACSLHIDACMQWMTGCIYGYMLDIVDRGMQWMTVCVYGYMHILI